MGTLTESMTRLCGEIVALRGARLTFVRDLGQDVAAMKADFRRAHVEMARRTKAERRAALNHLKKTVGGMRREFALDLAGAHRAWFGPTPAERRAQAETERRAKAEAERRVQAETERRAKVEAERRVQAEAERRAKVEAEQRAKEAAERDRLAALAMAKEEALRQQAAQRAKEAAGRPAKKKG